MAACSATILLKEIMSSKRLAVVIDANILIAICTNEQSTHKIASTALDDYDQRGFTFFAPSVIIAEVLYVLCLKANQNLLTVIEHEKAVQAFVNYLKAINLPPNGEASLITRAEEIRRGYGCSRTSDGLYIALAEQLTASWMVEILTFDNGYLNQAANNAPSVKVNVLTI